MVWTCHMYIADTKTHMASNCVCKVHHTHTYVAKQNATHAQMHM